MIIRILALVLLVWCAAWIATGGNPPRLDGAQDYGKIGAPRG